jgi:hypothetical protein
MHSLNSVRGNLVGWAVWWSGANPVKCLQSKYDYKFAVRYVQVSEIFEQKLPICQPELGQ